MSTQPTTRRTCSSTARASWRWNRHDQHAPMTDANRERAKELPRLGVQANTQPSNSPLLANK